MRRLLLIVLLAVFPFSLSYAAGSKVDLIPAKINPEDKKSLKRGAQFFVDYCFGCHSAAYMRFSRITKDLGLTEEEVSRDMIYTGAKIGDTMDVSMKPEDAKRWFGTPAPDLTVVSRSRGLDWINTYLRSFYKDESRPWGVNNSLFKDVAMPHVLWELQGLQEAVFETRITEDGQEIEVISGFKLPQPGRMSAEQYDKAISDLVNFLDYMGEPAKAQRLSLGKWVLLFLTIFLLVVYLLKKEYWKDIH